jgi:hypothetical protein
VTEDEDSLQDHAFGDSRDAIRDRARTAGLSFDVEEWSSDEDDPDQYILTVYLPNGKQRRSVMIDRASADDFEAIRFESLVALGDYRAVFDKESGRLEALLQAPTGQALVPSRLVELPGVEIFEFDSDTKRLGRLIGSLADLPKREGLSGAIQVTRRGGGMTWRLPIGGAPGATAVEISPPSNELSAIIGSARPSRSASLKLSGVQYETHDAALALLEDYANDVLFDIDIRFSTTLVLARRPLIARTVRRPSANTTSHPVEFPRTRYSHQATTLYFYAKSLSAMPPLQYLSYYQAIEHHFPRFFQQDLTARVRNYIRDPRFSAASDVSIRDLIGIASRTGRGTAREREQLKATLAGSLDLQELIEFLNANETVYSFVSTKGLIGVPLLRLPQAEKDRDAATILSQLAERIYAIRCRIVHTKDDANETFAEPLMPYSAEAALLRPDLRLIEFLSQKIIIAGGADR